MFTGIVQGAFAIDSIDRNPGLHSLNIVLSDHLIKELQIGASIAVDGVCLTVTTIEQNLVSFDVIQETLALTNLDNLQAGDNVNIERSAKYGVEVGGHIISGHVDSCAEITNIDTPENNLYVTYRVCADIMRYIFKKGFISLNGCSLTVADVNKETNEFIVCYIPETLRMSTHGEKKIGSYINLEIDRQTQVIVDSVESYMQGNYKQLLV